jgi:AraC family transcriptional regulator, regulatory protein of adaptative response / DNA-3-methyladenine glycosylase II
MHTDADRCYAAMGSRDARFDGWFVVGVTSTGIYCRPSCPARTPKREHVRFFAVAAAAQGTGFRACKRCRPDTTPGSPEWDVRADLVGRAMRLIADGVVDRQGVTGLAVRLGYSSRHVHRQLVAALGAGPLALARAQRAQTARVLIESTGMPFTDVAFAAGFASVRQFNDVVRAVFAATPTALRARRGPIPSAGSIAVRLPFRQPLAAERLFAHLRARAVPGLEEATAGGLRRSLTLPRGSGLVTLLPLDDHVRATFVLAEVQDLAVAVGRCRRLLDLDADPIAVDAHLCRDPGLAPLVTAAPGLRAPGSVDPEETALRTVLGQQVSVAGAATLTGRLIARVGAPLPQAVGTVTRTFPGVAAVAAADLDGLGLPRARATALRTLATALADGSVVLDPGTDREVARAALRALPGVGAWTAECIALRALGDPDAFPATDLALRRGAEALALGGDRAAIDERAGRWRPWRAYAAQHLWTAGMPTASPALASPALASPGTASPNSARTSA